MPAFAILVVECARDNQVLTELKLLHKCSLTFISLVPINKCKSVVNEYFATCRDGCEWWFESLCRPGALERLIPDFW